MKERDPGTGRLRSTSMTSVLSMHLILPFCIPISCILHLASCILHLPSCIRVPREKKKKEKTAIPMNEYPGRLDNLT